MRKLAIAFMAAAATLGGCTQTIVSPVSVTRFTGDDAARLGQGTIAVQAAPGVPGGTLEFTAWEKAVATELTRLGYRVVANGEAGQVAELRASRSPAIPETRRNPVSVGVGGSTGSYGSGLGVGLGIDLSGPPPMVTRNNLGVMIRDLASGRVLWEGRAEFSASTNSAFGPTGAAAQKMAGALFAGFPGESGATIEVK